MSDRNDFSHRKSTNKPTQNKGRKPNSKPENPRVSGQRPTSSSRDVNRDLNRLDRPTSNSRTGRPESRPPERRRPVQKPRPKRKHYINSSFSKAIVLLFIIFSVYGIGMFYSLFNTGNIESMVLKSIDITKNDTYPAIIIRDETVYQSPVDGYLSIVAKELEKVSKGSLIFTVSKDNNPELTEELTKVEDELFNLQAFREEYSNYRGEIDQIQSSIQSNIDNFSYDSYSDISEITDSINNTLEIRKQIVFADQRIADTSTSDSKQIIEDKIDSNSTKTYATDGGIISYTFDGLESTITPEEMKNFTIDQTKMDSKFSQHDDVITAKGDNIMRVVETNIWYIGTYISQKDAQALNVGDNKTLFVDVDGNFKEIPARVNYVSESIDDSVYVIFEVRSYMQDFINKRNINVALKSLTYMNMKVPTTAIVYKEYLKIPVSYVRETDKAVVIKKSDDGTPISVPITIDGKDETGLYYLIDRAKNDLLVGSVLVNPDNAQETFLIPEFIKTPGVYKINNGVATFEKVQINSELDESYDTSEFVYILPTATLKEYDRILVNASSAVEGQIIQ